MGATLGDVLPLEILPEIDRYELATHMTVRKFKQDEIVYHQGDPAAHAFVVFEGLVKNLLLDENGHELLVSLHMRGEFFGELAFFEEKAPRDGTAAAVMPSTVLQIERDGALAVLRRNEEARRFMFAKLTHTIRNLEGKAEDLAAAIGSTRMTVNKLLADFERRGLIDVAHRNVRVLDEPLLLREIQA